MEKTIKRWNALPYGVRFAARQAVSFLLGVLLAQTRLFGALPAFAIALTASADASGLAAACLGAAAGSALFASSLQGALVGAAAAAACGMIRFAADVITETPVTAVMAATIAFLCCAAAGLTTLLASGFYLSGVLQYLCDGVLAAGSAWFFRRARTADALWRQSVMPNASQAIPAVAAISILLLSLCFVHVYVFVPARFLAALFIMIAAYVFAEQGGAIVGIFCGVTMEVALDTPYLACCWSLGGLLGGMAGRRGMYAIPATAATVAFAYALLTQDRNAVAVFAETAAAGAVFCLLPKSVLKKVRAPQERGALAGRQDAALRETLQKTAAAASQITPYLARQTLRQGTVPGTSRMIERVRALACTDCGSSALCWETKQTQTESALAESFRTVYRRHSLSPDTLPELLRTTCVRRNMLCASCVQAYEELSRVPSQDGVMQTAGDPFATAADLLADTARQSEAKQLLLRRESENALHLLRANGVPAHSAVCYVQDGRTVVQAQTGSCAASVRKAAVTAQLGRMCGCRFSLPTVTATGETFRWCFYQTQRFRLRTGTAQHAADGKRCGDFFLTFAQDGKQTFLLSDGMGTGGSAQLDAQSTAEIFASLLRAGASPDCALRTVNAAMMQREDTESAATLDMVQVDLFTGKTVLYKAGAAPTYWLHDGKTERIEMPCMPVGILPQAQFACAERTVRKGDVLVLVTDGVCAAQDLAIRFSLGRFGGGSANELAETILRRAVSPDAPQHTDDATVLAVVVE